VTAGLQLPVQKVLVLMLHLCHICGWLRYSRVSQIPLHPYIWVPVLNESSTRVFKLELNCTQNGIKLTRIALVFTRSRFVVRLSASVRDTV